MMQTYWRELFTSTTSKLDVGEESTDWRVTCIETTFSSTLALFYASETLIFFNWILAFIVSTAMHNSLYVWE